MTVWWLCALLAALLAAVAAKQTNMETVFQWTTAPLAWPDEAARRAALRSGEFNPALTMPFGLEVAGNRIFFSFGNFRPGVPVTLATVPRPPPGKQAYNSTSPAMQPYPSWSWQWRPAGGPEGPGGPGGRSCDAQLVNVIRVKADRCGRLWAPDYGRHAVTSTILLRDAHCPPKLVVFDLSTDRPIRTYRIPQSQYTRGTVPVSVAVDDADGCEDAFAYLSDSIGYSLTVYSWRNNTAWRIHHPSLFGLNLRQPSAHFLHIQGVRYYPAPDGLYQLEFSAPGVTPVTGRRSAFWHTLTSFHENWVDAKVLRDPSASMDTNQYRRLGERGRELGQQVVKAVDRHGVMFYTLARLDALACWDTTQPYTPRSQALISEARGPGSLGDLYPCGLAVVDDEVWMLTSAGLRTFAPGPGIRINPKDFNIVVYRASARDLTAGTVCDPNRRVSVTDTNRLTRG